jgi:hypothetical protein
MPDQPAARGAERRANRQLAPARRRARELQAGDVRARDQQDERDRGEQDQRRRLHAADDLVAEPHEPERPAGVEAGIRGRQPRGNAIGLGPRLAERRAIFEPAENPHGPRAARKAAAVERIGAERQPHVGGRRKGQEREAGRQHADDLHRAAVEGQRGADGIGGRCESTLPQAVADQRDRRSARTFFRSGQCPSQRGAHAEHVEEVARDHRELHLLRVCLSGHVSASERPRGETVVTAAVGPKIFEVRLRQRQLELALLRLASPEKHEAVGVREGKRVEYDAVDNREHRGGRADPERERDDGDQREAGRPEQPAGGVSEVLEHVPPLANRLPERGSCLSACADAS